MVQELQFGYKKYQPGILFDNLGFQMTVIYMWHILYSITFVWIARLAQLNFFVIEYTPWYFYYFIKMVTLCVCLTLKKETEKFKHMYSLLYSPEMTKQLVDLVQRLKLSEAPVFFFFLFWVLCLVTGSAINFYNMFPC